MTRPVTNEELADALLDIANTILESVVATTKAITPGIDPDEPLARLKERIDGLVDRATNLLES